MNPQSNEQQRAGRVRWTRQPTPYERFMAEEGIPVVRGIGLYDVREVSLSPWARLAGGGVISSSTARKRCGGCTSSRSRRARS